MTWRRLLNKRTKFPTRKQSVVLCRKKKKKKTKSWNKTFYSQLYLTISNSEHTLGKKWLWAKLLFQFLLQVLFNTECYSKVVINHLKEMKSPETSWWSYKVWYALLISLFCHYILSSGFLEANCGREYKFLFILSWNNMQCICYRKKILKYWGFLQPNSNCKSRNKLELQIHFTAGGKP